ncbi:MAG: LPP20 family lipoprotein [Spirochaetales bacterium]|nr:LPP20 family lipoprotein [Spirochaetales bacterium]
MKFNIKYIIIILSVSIFLSCTTVPGDSSQGTLVNTQIGVKEIVVDGVIDFTLPEYRFMWNTAPDNGKLLFSSFIPRRSYREDEVALAISDSARQASILYNANVEAKFAVKSNNRDLGYLEAIDIQYDNSLAAELESKIVIRNHFVDNEGTYILAELEGVKFKGSFSDLAASGDEPEWLYKVPEIDGYLVSIGSVQRSRYKIDSIRKADEQALANLAKQVSVIVKAKRTDRDSEISGSTFSETNYEVTSTFVRGFYVLGRWSTDNGNTYHTLAVCPGNQ